MSAPWENWKLRHMDCYHFTHQPGMTGIVGKKRILASDAAMPPEGIRLERYGVHLTTDARPEGHGLPDGSVITEEQVKVLGYRVLENDQPVSLNHRAFRLRIAIPDDDARLVRFLDLPGITETFTLAADITAYMHVPETDPERLLQVEREIRQKLARHPSDRKSGSWLIYKGDLPLELVKAVAYRLPDGRYNEGTLQQFLDAIEN